MIENPNPSCLTEAPLLTVGTYMRPAGFEISRLPVKYLLKPSRLRIGSLDLSLLARAWLDGESELVELISNPKRMGFARPDEGRVILKREDPVTEMHELTHMWQDEVNPDFTDSTPEITGKNPLTQKLLIRHMVREGIAVWTSFILTLGSDDPAVESSARERLAFLERNKEKRYRNVAEITTGFPSNIRPVHFRVSHYVNAVKQMGYDAYTAGLFYVNARMSEQSGHGASLQDRLMGIMDEFPDEINNLLDTAGRAPQVIRLTF